MNEYILDLLKENGYDYQHGSIIDAEGNFVSSITLGGETINSETDESTYKALLDHDKGLEDKESFIETFERFEEDPINNPLPAEAEEIFPVYKDYKLQNYDPLYQETAEELAKDREQEAFDREDDVNFNAIELFRDLQEKGYEEIDDQYINEFKKNEALIRKYEEEDPSTNVRLSRMDDTDERLAENSFFNPQNVSLYIEKGYIKLAKALNTGLFGESLGMKGTDEEKQEYEDALEKRKAMKEPAVKIVREENKAKKAELETLWNELSTAEKWDPTNKQNSLVGYAIRQLDKDETRLTDYLEESNVYNPFNEHFLTKAITFGLRDAYDAYFYDNYLHNKLNGDEELTEQETLAAEALAQISKSHGLGLEQRFLHEAIEGAAESGVFVLGMLPGGGVMRGTTATITRGVSKSLATKGAKRAVVKGAAKDLAPELIAKNTAKAISRAETAGKIAGESVNIVGTSVIHPMSHVEALNRYNGSIHFLENDDGSVQLSTDRKTYGILMEEMKANKRMLEDLIDIENDPEKVKFLLGESRKLDEMMSSLEPPKGMAEASMYGLTETFKEVAIEKVGGPLLTRGAGAITSKYANKSWVKGIRNSKTAQSFNKANNAFLDAKNKYNKVIEGITGTPTFGNKLVGNNLEEIAEEVTQQILPAWGESDEEKAERKAELVSGMFYAQVSVQTLIMGAAMKAGSTPFQVPSYLKDYYKNKDSRKAFKGMIKEFQKGGVDAAKAEEMLMSIGEGKHSVQEYNNIINKYREEGNHEAANNMEKNKYFNIGKEMIKLGKGRAFIRGMNSAIAQGQITGESVGVVRDVMTEVRALERDMENHGNLRNRDYIIELNSRERYIKKQKEELENLKIKLEGQEASPTRDGSLKGINESLTALEKASNQIQKELKHETSTKMKDRLEKEAMVSKDLISEYKKQKNAKDEAGKELSTEQKIDNAIKSVKDNYGILASSDTMREAGKTLDSYVISEIFKDVLKQVEKSGKNTTKDDLKKKKEGSERSQKIQDHAEEIGDDVDAVTDLIDEEAKLRKDLEDSHNTDGVDGGVENSADIQGDPDAAANNTFDSDYFDPDEAGDFFDDLMPGAQTDAFERLKNAVKDVVDMLEKETGERPTFQDYIDELLSEGKVPMENIKNHMRALALAWGNLGYGKSNWKKVYENLFESPQGYLDALNSLENRETTVTPQEIKENEESQEEVANKKSTVTPVKFIPNSGKPVHTTPNSSKTFGTELFLHYSGVEFTQTTEKDGEKTVYVKINSNIPKMRENDYYDIKSLVHPNKNNIGDRLTVRILEGNDLADMPVAVRGKYGIQSGTITFEEWVNRNIPEGMSFEDFKKTDEYIAKVPIALVDSAGNPVAPVTEVDWYNEVSVGDTSLEFDDVDLDNLTESHKEDIAENREQALNLRKAMLEGSVLEVEIQDNLSFPPLHKIAEYDDNGEVIPTKPLNEVAPDSRIVMMTSTGSLVDLEKRNIPNTEDIVNLGNENEGLQQRKMVDRGGVMVPLPINANKAFYLTHYTTVDGVKKYIALPVNRKNESQGDSANETDVQTARWIVAINNIVRFGDTSEGSQVLRDKKHPLHMSKEQAEDIRQQIIDLTGIDVKTKYTALVEGMIAHQAPGKDGAKTAHASKLVEKLRNYNKGTGEFLTSTSEFVQNTFLSKPDASLTKTPMIQIKKEADGSFTVEKVPITPFFENGVEVTEARGYEDYLKERLSTNVMGYNVGTESNPVFTVAPQQKIKFRPIEVEVDSPEKVLTKKVEDQKKEKEVIKKVKEVDEKEVSSDSKAITELTQEQKKKRAVAMENAAALAKELNLDLKDIDDADYLVASELTTTKEVKDSISIIEGLTIKQEEDVIKWVFSKLSDRDATIGDAKHEISRELTLRIEKLNEAISNLQEFKGNPVVDNMQDNLVEARTQLENTLDNTDKLLAEATLRAKNVDFVTDDDTDTEYELDEKDYSKSNAETKPIDKVGTALKRIFARVTNGEKGFMGLESYTSFKQMYDTISLALSSDINLEADFNTMMALLTKRQESTPWMKPLIEALKESDEQVKNQFVYNTYRQKINAKFSSLAFDNNKGIKSAIYASNSNEAQRAVVDSWRENFKRSKINDKGFINTRELQKALDEWNSWTESGHTKQTDKTYQKWLGRFGIELSDRTWKALRDGELNVSEAGGRLRPAKFEELFDGMTSPTNTNRPGFLFTNLLKFASLNRDQKDASKLEFLDQKLNHPFTDMGTILKQLSELEAKYNPSYSSTTRYVGGKSVTEIESYNYFYEQFKKLKESALGDKKYLLDMEKLSFSQDSYLLKMLLQDDVFAHQFDHGMMDLMAIKELYKKSPMNAGIDDLSSFDYMFSQRTNFQDRDQGSPKIVEGIPFEVRMAHMNTLTNSDKGRMMLLKTGVLDLFRQSEEAFNIDGDGNITFTDKLQGFLYSQMVLPEVKRMVKFLQTIKETNIDGYNEGAVRFNIIPGMNAILNSEGLNVSQFISENLETEASDLITKIQEQFGEGINEFLQENIVTEAVSNANKLSQFEEKGVDTFNNAKYLLNRKGTVVENKKIAELDFIINSMLTNMSYMQLMAGDPALYFNSSTEGIDHKDSGTQTKLSQRLAINLGKRMAAMIAPGSVLANSKNNSYVQIFLEDIYGHAENLIDIVGWHYTEAEMSELGSTGQTYKQMLLDLKNGDDTNIKELKNRFSRIAEFISIEATDAQEYTTLEEHLYVMEKQGRLNKKQLRAIRKSIKKGEDLTTEQLESVMQPLKPVYTGTIYDSKQDVNRMMYIKSSSFPLIPQLTRGRNLDALRIQMEGVEQVYGKTVRASYNSANKVGGLTSEYNVKSFNQPINGDNLLILPREHFKIQQDVPNHSAKVQEDRVSMGTQMFKLLMGDGIMEITNSSFKVNGVEYNGKEIKSKFEQVFGDMVNINRDKFLSSLGLDADMNPIDKTKTMKKLEKLLNKEAKSRGFSKQDLKTLSLVDDGNGGKTFKLPLWLSGNSNKYESMLNALINNKIFKQKIPGVKFVAGSEAGFEVKESRVGLTESRIIHIGKYKGGTLESVKNEGGEITSAQVLAPSRFKVNGVLVDLFEDFDGVDGTYIQIVDGELKIKEHMLSPELLEMFVFRIPTSSHGLGARVEIVGFLPPESGDLIITPKSFVAQMGQDFDIDSLTSYQLNHLVMDDGSIKELTEENRDDYIIEQMRKIDALEYEIRKNGLTQMLPNLDPLSEDIKEVKEDFREFMEVLINEGATTEAEAQELLAEMKSNIRQDFDYKLLQNEFIKIHNAVYANPEVQGHINKVLSMSYAEQQADDIESLQATAGNSFNILSPDYQMTKLNAGSTGQDAIKVYAKGVTLHSLVQQAVSEGNYVGLSSEDVDIDTNVTTTVKKGVQIGNLTSQGNLGRDFSIVPKGSKFKSIARRISTILDERTNTGTDNEKAQILGRTGLNHTDAISVDNLLSLLGFDSEFTEITEEEYEKGAPFHRETVIDGKKVFYKERSIPYLLHSQPIIKEYFDLLNSKRSVITPFSGKPQEEAIQQLLNKYGDPKKGRPTIAFGEFSYMKISPQGVEIPESNQNNSSFTADMLERQIVLGDKANKNSQLQVLALYTDLIADAKKVKDMMGHVDLNNLGKSMWESTTKAQEFRDFFTAEGQNGILGAEHLVGDVMHTSEVEAIVDSEREALILGEWSSNNNGTYTIGNTVYAPNDLKRTIEGAEVLGDISSSELINLYNNRYDSDIMRKNVDKFGIESRVRKSFLPLGDHMHIRPKTNQGVMVGTALSLSEALFKDIFPAKSPYINSVMESVMSDSNINTSNSFSVIKAKEQIFQEVKKYLTSSEGLGLFNKPAGQVRRELFVDDLDNGHQSLSNYVGSLRTSESLEFEEGVDFIKNNLFLNHLRYVAGENGKPSTITFNNQESFEADQEAIYASFKELILEDHPLPGIKRNGITEGYSTRILAQELYAYSYVSGGVVQGAVQFHKYLPIEYLDDMVKPTRSGKMVSSSQRLRAYNRFTSAGGVNSILFMFKRQYFQNNPESLKQFTMKEVKLEDGNSFFYATEEGAGKFVAQRVATKSKLKQDRWRVFERIEGDDKHYREISVLGETGMSEYEFNQAELTSNLGKWKPKPVKIDMLGLETIEHGELGTIPKNKSKHVDFLQAIIAGEYGDYKYMKDTAEYLLQFVDENSTFEYMQGASPGVFRESTGIYINPDAVKSREELALTFLHETVHSLSSPYINKFLSRDIDNYGELNLDGAPSELIGLQKVLDSYRTQLRNMDVDKYDEFQGKLRELDRQKKSGEPITMIMTPTEIALYYPTMNLKEFMATALANNSEFLEVAGKMPYYSTGGSVFRKFGDLITKLIKRIGKGEKINENSLALEAINNSFYVIERIHQKGIEAKQQTKKEVVEKDPDLDKQGFIRARERDVNLEDVDGPIDNQGDPDLDTRNSDTQDLLPQMRITKNTCK